MMVYTIKCKQCGREFYAGVLDKKKRWAHTRGD